MTDYRDDHSPDIALLLTVARTVRTMLEYHLAVIPSDKLVVALDAALKPFDHYPDPVDPLWGDHDLVKTEKIGA